MNDESISEGSLGYRCNENYCKESVMNILRKEIRLLLKELGWNDLTEPQLKAIPLISKGYNVLIIAPTGLGKTEAALLPVFNMILSSKPPPINVLYITPLKALINDLYKRISWWASRLRLNVSRKHSEVSRYEKSIRLKKVPDILITTPEGLEIDLDWATKFRQYYKNIKWVIVDEVHELINSKRGIQLSILLERLRSFINYDFQVIGLSATIGNPLQAARLIFGSSRRKGCILESSMNKSLSLIIDSKTKGDSWNSIAECIEKHLKPPTLIFVNSRFAAERIHEVLESKKLKDIYVHHSSISRGMKTCVEDLLKNGKVKGVICTKTLELGIDIADVDLVIQVNPPGSVTTLIQRVGRSGHDINRTAQGVLICDDPVDVLECIATSRLALKGELEKPKILEKPLDVLSREILGICLERGEVHEDEIFKIIKKSYPYRNMSREEFDVLIKYLIRNNMLLRTSNNKVKLGPAFFRIWRFNESSAPWSRSFSEFFSLINERPSFIVKCNNNVIGEVDAHFVYKHLRVGDVFRLSGKTWIVTSIDEFNMKVEVSPVSKGEAEIPLWRGETQPRDYIISREMMNIIREILIGGQLKKLENLTITKEALIKLKQLVQNIKTIYENIIPEALYIERSNNETFFITFMGEKVSATLAHILLYKISTDITLNVQARISPIGFSIRVKGVDPLKILLDIKPKEILTLAVNAARRSPLLNLYLKNIQHSFGKIGKLNDVDDEIIINEACKQLIQEYFDIPLTVNYLSKVIGEGRIIKIESREPSLLARYISKFPPIKPWIRDITLIIINTLEGSAFTVEELSIMLNLPEKSIENKLKDLRRSAGQYKVFQFIDVDIGEWRWALEKDLKSIVNSELYKSSFTPLDYDERFIVVIKLFEEDHGHVIYVTAREILNRLSKIMAMINDVAYEVRIEPLLSLIPKLYVRYYHVSKETLPYIMLNGITFLQKVKSNL